MKNILFIDFDTNRTPSLVIGKPRNAVIDTGGQPMVCADLDVILNALIVSMRIVESSGVAVKGLMEKVIKAIEKGVFDANLKIECKEK